MGKKSIINDALKKVYPEKCPLCGKVTGKDEILCVQCGQIYPPQHIRLPLMNRNGQVTWCNTVYTYTGQVRVGLHAMKFGNQPGRAEGFGRLMANLIPKRFDRVTFVPMSRIRRMWRGYNQAELLAKGCAAACGLPVCNALVKRRGTRTQHRLSAEEREQNTVNAYSAKPMSGARVVLCDDITTTGATLRACAKALYDAGAAEVLCLCVACVKGEL